MLQTEKAGVGLHPVQHIQSAIQRGLLLELSRKILRHSLGISQAPAGKITMALPFIKCSSDTFLCQPFNALKANYAL